jgi:SAM-dependent methyltransferase
VGDPSAYFGHYARENDLSEQGRRRLWPAYSVLYLPLLPQRKDARILDLGCGAGLLLEWLRDREGYVNLYGVDSDRGQVAFATKLGLRVEQTTADPCAWLVAHQPFDAIVMKDVLEHLPPGVNEKVLVAVFQCLSPRGRLVLTVPNASAAFAARQRYNDPTHYRAYTEYSLTYELEAAGFSSIRVLGEDCWRPGSFRGALRLGVKVVVRAWRRFEAIAEYGQSGIHFPLSPNLLALGFKSS